MAVKFKSPTSSSKCRIKISSRKTLIISEQLIHSVLYKRAVADWRAFKDFPLIHILLRYQQGQFVRSFRIVFWFHETNATTTHEDIYEEDVVAKDMSFLVWFYLDFNDTLFIKIIFRKLMLNLSYPQLLKDWQTKLNSRLHSNLTIPKPSSVLGYSFLPKEQCSPYRRPY